MPHASSKWLGKNIPNDYETNHNVTTINIIALENNSTINETLAAVKPREFFYFFPPSPVVAGINNILKLRVYQNAILP